MDKTVSNSLKAGLIAGVAMNVVNWIDYYILHKATLRFLDWAAVLIYGGKTNHSIGLIFALFAQIFFCCFVGIIYGYLTKKIKDLNPIFKGWFYSTMVWFFIYAIHIMYRIPEIGNISVSTAISNFIGTSIYGLVLGYVFEKLSHRKSL